MRKYIEKAFTLFTISSIVTGLFFIFHYTGGKIGISVEYLEKFRLNGKPFVNLVLALLQLSLLSAAWWTVRKNAKSVDIQQTDLARQSKGIKSIESEHNINISPGSYYWVMLRKNRGDLKYRIQEPFQFKKRILFVKQPKSLDDSEKQILQRKVTRMYYIQGIFMFTMPLNNLFINLLYIYQYTFSVDLPFPEGWIDTIQQLVLWNEKLWDDAFVAIGLCIVEIIIAGYIFYTYLGNPFKSIN